MKLASLIEAGASQECSDPVKKAIAAAYWAGQSSGQEVAESSIRRRLNTLPLTRYHGVQRQAVKHLLEDNPCARKAPVLPAYSEIREWDFAIA